jgi:hypothetical protein
MLYDAMAVVWQNMEEHGRFVPYAIGMLNDGGMVFPGDYNYYKDPKPPPADLVLRLKAALANGARRREYKATAFVYLVKVRLPTTGAMSDAVAVALDHRDEGYSVVVFLPYDMEDGLLEYRDDDAYAEPGDGAIFPK